jgi:hypothetical protein
MMIAPKKASLAWGIVLATLVTSSCFAEEPSLLGQQQILSLFTPIESAQATGPGVSAGSPSAYGSGWGTVFIGGSLVSETQDSAEMDGSGVIGMGFGDADKFVTVDVAVGIISVDTRDGGFAEDGNFNFAISRNVTDTLALAVGVDNAYPWGSADEEAQSYFGVLSDQYTLSTGAESQAMPLTISLGYGTGTYQGDAQEDDGIANTVGIFGSVALQLKDNFSVIGDWSGDRLNAGVSFVPFKKIRLVTSLIATDVTNRTGNKVPVTFSVGYGHLF